MDLDEALAAAARLPRDWTRLEPGYQLFYLRSALRISQRHLAEAAGLHHPVVARLEGGADARLSTWRRVFEALGYFAVLAPVEFGDEWQEVLADQREERRQRQLDGLEGGR